MGHGCIDFYRRSLVAALGSYACAATTLAHHSTAEYDNRATAESRGEIVSVLWRNPHVRFEISTEALDGDDTLWELEGTDVTRLDREGVPRDLIAIGDVVAFAGNPSTRKGRRMYVTNMLLPDGREILLRGAAEPRFAAARVVNRSRRATEPPPVTAADGSFFDKVLVPTRGPAPDWLRNPPLTDAARAGQAAYDAVTDDPVLGCVTPGMPRVLSRSGPYAIQFVLEGNGDIVQQNEWFEIDRLIRMDGRPPPEGTPYTPLGYSVGRFDGDALIVTTTHIDWPYFQLYGLEGVPQTRAMRIVERFTPSDGGATLRYDLSATDPGAFTETVTYENYVTFRWDPTVEFLPYDCIEEERSALSP